MFYNLTVKAIDQYSYLEFNSTAQARAQLARNARNYLHLNISNPNELRDYVCKVVGKLIRFLHVQQPSLHCRPGQVEPAHI